MGKGRLAQVIAHHTATDDSNGPVLVLAPGPVALQFASGVGALEPRAQVDVVDRRKFRELLAGPREDGVFRPGEIVVTSIDFAKQDDVLKLLADTQWSLVVVDEAHHARDAQSVLLVERLAELADRVLLLSASDLVPALAAAIPELQTVRWSRDVVDAQGHRLFVEIPRRIHVVDYRRSEEEVRFADDVMAFLDAQPVTVGLERRSFLKAVLVKVLSSSPLATQDLLIRLRDRLRANAEESAWWGDDSAESDDHELAVESFAAASSATGSAASDLDDLISDIDSVRDSKEEALRGLVGGFASLPEPRRFVVFTVFVNTAAYVSEILLDAGHDVHVVTGSVPVAQRTQAVEDWKSSSGALILTEGAVEGLSLTETHLAVHYDLPATVEQMEQRWGRLDRVGQRETVEAYVLRDLAGTLEWEEQLLRLHGFLE